MRVAYHLVSNSVRLASTFERYRVSNVPCLYRRPFSFPKNPNPVAKGAVRFCVHLSPEPVSAKQRLIVFALCVRPPPSV